MNIDTILSSVDHTLLSQTAGTKELYALIDDAVKYKTASVCIAPCFVKEAVAYSAHRVKICTVIGFPNGYNTKATKLFETLDALDNGADEIDMVANLGQIKEGSFEAVTEEIAEIKAACKDKVLKVIIEACLLNEQEKIAMCKAVTCAGADYIKTSTGFSTGGAVVEDIKLFTKHIGKNVLIKAAGGISSLQDAENLLNAGASRLGTSKIILLAKKKKDEGGY